MMTMRPSFYSLTAAIVFLALGVFMGMRSSYGWQLMIDTWSMPVALSWAFCGLMFVMAYFSLAHMRTK